MSVTALWLDRRAGCTFAVSALKEAGGFLLNLDGMIYLERGMNLSLFAPMSRYGGRVRELT